MNRKKFIQIIAAGSIFSIYSKLRSCPFSELESIASKNLTWASSDRFIIRGSGISPTLVCGISLPTYNLDSKKWNPLFVEMYKEPTEQYKSLKSNMIEISILSSIGAIATYRVKTKEILKSVSDDNSGTRKIIIDVEFGELLLK